MMVRESARVRARAAGVVLAAALASVVAGCAPVGPDFSAPVVPAAASYTPAPLPARTMAAATAGGAGQRLVVGNDIRGDWWALFRSPRIEELVSQALRANPGLAAAQATLQQARENLRAEQGGLFPALSASADATREKLSPFAFGSRSGVIPPLTLYNPSIALSYSPDLFGAIRRHVEQLGAQVDYQRYELEAAYLSLTANVVATALNEAALQAQIEATQEIIRLYSQELDVARRRFDLGGVSRADVLSQQANLAAAVATLPPLQKQLQQTRNQLAVYLGTTPGQFTGPTINLAALTLPEDLPVSVPSRLVEQRPDIKAYEALLHSATAQVGIDTANLLPQVTLTGSYGREANTLATLFTPAGIVWSLAAAISQPLFQGGTLNARRRASIAALQAAAAQYSSTVNTAFQSVADALVAIERDAEALRASVQSAQAAQESLNVARAQFAAGASTYVTVLQAQQTYQNARLHLVSAQAARFTDTVALFQALGGGWWNRSDVTASVGKCCGILP
jgi:NodT family efflux transporter outer membrane factor (OMF) lipoprotein